MRHGTGSALCEAEVDFLRGEHNLAALVVDVAEELGGDGDLVTGCLTTSGYRAGGLGYGQGLRSLGPDSGEELWWEEGGRGERSEERSDELV